MPTLLPEGKQSFANSAGAPLIGGKLYTYDAGTSTPRTTYQDAAGTVPNTNPIALDARGEATVFWSGVYKVVLKDASESTVWVVDNVADGAEVLRADLAAPTGSSLVGYMSGGVGAVATDLQTVLRESLNVLRFMPKEIAEAVKARTHTGSVTTYLQTALVCAGIVGKDLYAPAGFYPVVGLQMVSGVRLFGEKGSNTSSRIYPAAATTTGTFFQQFSAGDLLVYPYDSVRNSEVDSITFYGGDFSSGRGVVVNRRTFTSTIKNCLIQMFPEQGMVMGGQICRVFDNNILFNCQYQPENYTFYKGGLELYGGDNYVLRNEVQGPVASGAIPVTSPVPLVNANGYSVACIVSCFSSWICDNLFEIADTGAVLFNTHPDWTAGDATSIYGSGVCFDNTLHNNRIDFMRGHGIVIVPVSPASAPNRQGPRGNRITNTLVMTCGISAVSNAASTFYGIYEKAGTAGFNSASAYPLNNQITGTMISAAQSNIVLKFGVHYGEAFALQGANEKSEYANNTASGYAVFAAGASGFYDLGYGYTRSPQTFSTGLITTGAKLPGTAAVADVNTLDCYQEGSLTLTIAGLAEFTSISAPYTKIGNMVMVQVPKLNGTSNSTSLNITLPTGFIPVYELTPTFKVIAGGAAAASYASHSAGSGTLQTKTSIGGGSWAGSGTAVVQPFTLMYHIS